MNRITNSEHETLETAKEFAMTLKAGDVVALIGDLGAGITVFARGVALGLGIDDEITSPTFTLIHEYAGRFPLYHMDLYRMNSVEEIRDIGVEDYLYGEGVCLVEWAEKLGSLFPKDAIQVAIDHLGGTGRRISMTRNGGEL